MSRPDIITEAMRHYYRGRVFEATGELEIAIEEYRKAIKYGADYADVHNSLGRVLAKKGFLEEARIEFEQALRLNPRYLEAQKNLNELLTKISVLSTQKKQPWKPPTQQEQQLSQPQPQTSITTEPTQPQTVLEIPAVKRTSTLFYIFPLILLIISVVAVYKLFFKESTAIQKVLSLDVPTVSGIARYKNRLIISSWMTQEIVFYKILKNKITKSFIFQLSKDHIVPTSIAISEKNLWVLDGWNKKIYKYLLTEGTPVVEKMLDLKTASPIGIAIYKKYILVADNTDQQIQIYDQELKKIDSVPFIVKNLIAICSYNNKIWLLDKDSTLYELKNYAEVKNSFQLNTISKNISAFFVDNKYLWLAEEGEPKLVYYTKNVLK